MSRSKNTKLIALFLAPWIAGCAPAVERPNTENTSLSCTFTTTSGDKKATWSPTENSLIYDGMALPVGRVFVTPRVIDIKTSFKNARATFNYSAINERAFISVKRGNSGFFLVGTCEVFD